MKYEIVPITKLKPLEQVFPEHLRNLETMIDKDGFILKAIIIDKKTGIVLDGSHRYVYLLKNGYKEAPVFMVDYLSEDIRVGTRLEHRFFIEGTSGISKKECIDRGVSGNIYPPRTTRHFFPFRKSDISLPLTSLKKTNPCDVSDLVANVDISEELNNNKKYLEEISFEIEIIVNYLSEVSETKKYLNKQTHIMDMSRKVAFFPGKFHPPHIGHIQTILNIIPNYKKVIIGISQDVPKDNIITDTNAIELMLKKFFKSFNNIEVFSFSGILVEKEDINDLPKFDVIISGNVEVLNWAKKKKIKSQFIERSFDNLSGTSIRDLMINENK